MNHNRVVYLEQLNTFIQSTKDKLNHLLDTINWKKETLLCSKETRSSDSNLAAENLGGVKHEELQIEGIPDTGQVNISKQDLLNGILQTISFLLRNLGLNSETSASGHLYNEIVASLQQAEQSVNRKDVKIEDKAAALVQQMKLERDAKRRRISYKNKVHTKNKSHIEVLREVLGEQMLTLTEGQANRSSTNNGDQRVPNKVPELIAIRQPPGNPHLAWVTVIKEDKLEKSRTINEYRLQKEKSIHNKFRRHLSDHQPRFKFEENRKEHLNDSSRKEKEREKEGYDRHKEKEEGNGRCRDKTKGNDKYKDEEEDNKERRRGKKKSYDRHRYEEERNERHRGKKIGYEKLSGQELRYNRYSFEEQGIERYRDKEGDNDRHIDEENSNDRCSNEEEGNDRCSEKKKENCNMLKERKRKHSPTSDKRRHKKKKYKKSRSHSPGDDSPDYQKHKSKHKKKKH